MFFLLFYTFIISADYKVFYVKKEFDTGVLKNLQKDYYINIGSKDGVKKDVLLNVYRKKQLVDTTGESKIITTKVFVGKLKVISVDSDYSIARVHELSDTKNAPIPGYNQVMLGDSVEISKNDKDSFTFNLIKEINNENKTKSFFSQLINFFTKYL